MSEFYDPIRSPSVQDEEHRHNFCSENDSWKAASIMSLYLMMGYMPKKSNMCSVKASTAEVQAVSGCVVRGSLLSP